MSDLVDSAGVEQSQNGTVDATVVVGSDISEVSGVFQQRIACAADETGVCFQDLNGPHDLVDDALTGAMSRTEELEIFEPIVRPNAVNVMDCLLGRERAAEVLLHDGAMLEFYRSLDSRLGPHSDSQIAVSRGSGLGAFLVMVGNHVLGLSGATALGATDDLASVDRPSGSSRKSHKFSADHTVSMPRFVGQSAAEASALSRTVKRVFAEFLSVAVELSRVPVKKLAALFTGKLSCYHSSWPSVNGLVGLVAFEGTVLLVGATRFLNKINAALLAGECHFRRCSHLILSVYEHWYQSTEDKPLSTGFREGFV